MKKALIALALLALSAAAAHAELPEWARKTFKPSFVDIIPPPEYDYPYPGELTVIRARSQAHVRELCPTAPFVKGYPTLACATRSHDGWSCTIVLAPDLDIWKAGFTVEVIMRHENAHCVGWPGHHPGVRNWDGR